MSNWEQAQAIYTGPIKHLLNNTALLRPGCCEEKVLAQFNALHLKEAFGWHEIPRKDFVNFIAFGQEKT